MEFFGIKAYMRPTISPKVFSPGTKIGLGIFSNQTPSKPFYSDNQIPCIMFKNENRVYIIEVPILIA